jgi:hypothetical protein
MSGGDHGAGEVAGMNRTLADVTEIFPEHDTSRLSGAKGRDVLVVVCGISRWITS